MDNDLNKYQVIAERLKIMAHPIRLCILKNLLANGGCNVSNMQNCLMAPQSTVSQHLQKLRSAGLVKAQRKGLLVEYAIADPSLQQIIEVLFDEDKLGGKGNGKK